MIKAIIIDDEANCCDSLTILLKKYCPEVNVLAVAHSASEGKKAIDKHQPDLLFLDVEMPKENGFDLLGRYEKLPCEVIFTTAYSKYAIRAMRLSALDYLLKPIDSQELVQAIARYKLHPGGSPRIDVLKSNINDKKNERIIISTSQGYELIEVRDILWCKADSNYTIVYLTGGMRITATRSLKDFEEVLKDAGFFRIHHSHVVNMRHIRKYVKGEGGHVFLSDGTQVEVSARKKSEFLSSLEEYSTIV